MHFNYKDVWRRSVTKPVQYKLLTDGGNDLHSEEPAPFSNYLGGTTGAGAVPLPHVLLQGRCGWWRRQRPGDTWFEFFQTLTFVTWSKRRKDVRGLHTFIRTHHMHKTQSHSTKRAPRVSALPPAIRASLCGWAPLGPSLQGKNKFSQNLFITHRRLTYEQQCLTYLFNNHFILLRKIKLSNPGRKIYSHWQLYVNSSQFYFALSPHLPFTDIFDVCSFFISQGNTITNTTWRNDPPELLTWADALAILWSRNAKPV